MERRASNRVYERIMDGDIEAIEYYSVQFLRWKLVPIISQSKGNASLQLQKLN